MNAAISLLYQAEDKYKAFEFSAAKERFLQSFAIYPTVQANYGAAVCFFALKDYSQVILIAEKSLKSSGIYADKLKILFFKAYERLAELAKSKEILEDLILSSKCEFIRNYAESHLKRLTKWLTSNEEYQKIESLKTLDSEVFYLITKNWYTNWENYQLGQSKDSPGPINNSDIISKITDDCRDYASVILKEEILEDQDFITLCKPAYQYLQEKYSCIGEIKRFSVKKNGFTEIEIFLQKIQFLVCPKVSTNPSEISEIYISKRENLQEIISACKKLVESDFNSIEYNFDVFRVWKLPKLEKIENNEKIFLPQAEPLNSLPTSFDSEVFYVLEFQKNDEKWTISNQSEEICPSCNNLAELQTPCLNCKSIKYCSEYCLNTHSIVHMSYCNKLILRQGKTGLHNLGNTCYMNSVLQCLSHTVILTNYFLSKKYINDCSGPLIFTTNYRNLLEKLWGVNNGAVFPSALKRIIGIKWKNFAGFSQQDAHEFLVTVIHGLHDELKGREKEENNEDQWVCFLSKNWSFLSENMFGLVKSTVICPLCNFYSETFEPYLTFPIQVPNYERIQIPLYIFLSEAYPKKRIITCYYSWSTCELIKMIEAEFNAEVVIGHYSLFEFRGLVEKKEIGEYKGRVLVAYQKTDETGVVVTILQKKNRLVFDKIMFFPQQLSFAMLYYKILQSFLCIFRKNSEVSESFLSENMVIKLTSDKNSEEITPKAEKFIQINKNTRIIVEFFEIGLNWFKICEDLPSYSIQSQSLPNLLSSLKAMLLPETLDESNKWHCKDCNSHTSATKILKIVHFPKILIFHLLKFKNSLTKIETFFDFPMSMNLETFGCDKTYDLYAVSNHYGSYSFGHYTAFVKSYENDWLEMNDSLITSVSESSIVSSAAYILFYVQR